MKVAVITDTHFGVRGDSKVFADYQYKFYDEIFFPYLEEHKIDTIIHCGDLMDRRKYVNYNTLNLMRKKIIGVLVERGITMHTIVGNHDTYYKNTIEVNSVKELFDSTKLNYTNPIEAIEVPSQLILNDGTSVDVIPWINEQNEDEIMDFIDKSSNQVCFGHFDIAGFEMMRGVKSMYHSRSKDFLRKYDTVYSGHFHCKSDDGHVFYLGSPYEMTWGDYGDDRGFHIFDTESRSVEYIKNPLTMHEKIYYDDSELDIDPDIRIDHEVSKYTGKLVKLIVVKKTKWASFESLVDKLDSVVLELNIVEDFSLLHEDSDDVSLESEDTITVLNKVVDSLELDDDQDEVQRIIQELYVEAINL